MDRLESIKASFHPCLLLLQVSLLKKIAYLSMSLQVLELMKEVTEEEEDENISSDISGSKHANKSLN